MVGRGSLMALALVTCRKEVKEVGPKRPGFALARGGLRIIMQRGGLDRSSN